MKFLSQFSEGADALRFIHADMLFIDMLTPGREVEKIHILFVSPLVQKKKKIVKK